VGTSTLWIQQTVSVVIIIVGVYQIIEGNLSQGGLIAAYMLSSRIMAPVGQTAGLLMQYHSAATALTALDMIMQKPVERPLDANWISRPRLQGGIEFKKVAFKYPQDEREVLRDVAFKINPGERVAILGRNGSGKTTLEKLIAGLYEPTSGTVLLDGIDIRQLDPAELRRNMGYVAQDVNLFFGSLRDNIAMGAPHASDDAILEAVRLSGLTEFVNQHPMGLAMPVGEHGQLLSGGQRQSVSIARALLSDPPILLMDEPTGAMDHTSEEEFKRSLVQFAAHKTLLVITHRTSLLELVNRIIVIDGGKIVADGPKEQVVEALRQGRIGRAA
jgi:ATP-binding cassette subfamily C protein LapB